MSDALLQHQLNHAEYRVCQLNHENQKLREELGEYETEGAPVGWTIVGVSKTSVLCQNSTGARRRYMFELDSPGGEK